MIWKDNLDLDNHIKALLKVKLIITKRPLNEQNKKEPSMRAKTKDTEAWD